MNEEDIKNLSEIIELCEEEINNNDENVTAILDLTDLKSLRNLINRNKELEKHIAFYEKNGSYKVRIIELEEENEKLKNVVSEIFNSEDVTDNYIPKSKIKEKIEELNKKLNNGGKTYGRYGGCVINSENIMKLQNQIQVLEELLQKGE